MLRVFVVVVSQWSFAVDATGYQMRGTQKVSAAAVQGQALTAEKGGGHRHKLYEEIDTPQGHRRKKYRGRSDVEGKTVGRGRKQKHFRQSRGSDEEREKVVARHRTQRGQRRNSQKARSRHVLDKAEQESRRSERQRIQESISESLLSMRQKGSSSAANLGRSATLSEAGFHRVAATRSKAAMGAFVRRIVESKGLLVKDEKSLQKILPYFTGECANRGYEDLILEVDRATADRACHPAWLQDPNSDATHAEYQPSDLSPSPEPQKSIFTLLRGIISELGGEVVQGQRWHLWSFAQAMLETDSTYENLQGALQVKSITNQWLRWRQGEPTTAMFQNSTRTHALTGGARSWVVNIGKVTPITEDGYRATMYARSDEQMAEFIRRAANYEHLKLPDGATLAHLAPYYSGVCARQSYQALVRELRSMSSTKFLTHASYDLASEQEVSFDDVKLAVAAKLPMDAKKLEVVESDSALEEPAQIEEPSQAQESSRRVEASGQKHRKKRARQHKRHFVVKATSKNKAGADSMINKLSNTLPVALVEMGAITMTHAPSTKPVPAKPAMCRGGFLTHA